jgi:glyoxylase-like metal-dependent hydrolase (beta-lactamase superfamily II)
LATPDGVMLFDPPPTIGHNLQRAVSEVAAAKDVSNTVTHLVYTHHYSDHAGASSLFGANVVAMRTERPFGCGSDGMTADWDLPPSAGSVRVRMPSTDHGVR